MEITAVRIEGLEVVIKAGSGSHRESLRREAEVLKRLDSPHVVAFRDLLEGPDHTELHTIRHGLLTLSDAPLMTPGERLDLLRSACNAVADLHTLGWTHGNLSADHLLADTGPPGRRSVRICSLGQAEPLQTSSLDVPAVDGEPYPSPSQPTATELTSDRIELRSVLHSVLEANSDLGSRAERIRWAFAGRRLRRRLARMRRVPTAEELLTLLGGERPRAAAASEEPTSDGAAPAVSRRRPRGRSRGGVRMRLATLAATVIGAILVSLAVAAATPSRPHASVVDSAGGDNQAVATDSETLRAADSASGSRPAATDPPRVCLNTPPDDTGSEPPTCTAQVTVEGQEVLVGDFRFSVGVPGDLVVVGDWRCDGYATAAVLRTGTGAVYEFSDWATDAELTAELVGRIPGAKSIEPPADCGAISVATGNGSHRTLPLPDTGSG
jgi:hypothetical protein